LLRLELLTPATNIIPDAVYKKAYTLHGFMMIYYGLVPFARRCWGFFWSR
jgi:heme/copper-type cytochrome/quinol oxidase subunit 1